MFPLRRLCLVVALIVCPAGMSVAQTAVTSKEASHPWVWAFLEQERARAGAPGLAAAVAVGGEVVFSGGVGWAEIENQVPMTGRSVLNVGSVSKVNAVLGLLKLWEQGKLAWDDPLQKHLPWLPEARAPGQSTPVSIRLLHLLTHTSGYRHYLEDEEKEFGARRYRALVHYDSIREAAEIFMNDPLLFPPDAYYSYSSYATNLIQAVGEAAAGRPYEDFLREVVWRPAGMLTAGFDVAGRVVHGRGKGYRIDERSGEWRDANVDEDVSYKYTGGGMIMSVEDLARLGIALNHGRILKPASLEELYRTRFRVGNRPGTDADYRRMFGSDSADAETFDQGLILVGGADTFGRRWHGHSGGVKGTTSYFLNYPREDVVVAVRANGGSRWDEEACAQSLAQSFLPAAHSTREDGKPSGCPATSCRRSSRGARRCSRRKRASRPTTSFCAEGRWSTAPGRSPSKPGRRGQLAASIGGFRPEARRHLESSNDVGEPGGDVDGSRVFQVGPEDLDSDGKPVRRQTGEGGRGRKACQRGDARPEAVVQVGPRPP